MTSGKTEDSFWDQWRDIILAEYERRLGALGAKAYRGVSERKILTAIFLQVKGFPISMADILPETIRIIKGKDPVQPDNPSLNKEFDAIAMMGHRIGMLENSSGLKQYLKDVRAVLKPEGQILITSIDVSAAKEPECQSKPAFYGLQRQRTNLIGPFFTMIRIKADKLKSQTAAANWQCEFIYLQDDNNYVARLSLSESL